MGISQKDSNGGGRLSWFPLCRSFFTTPLQGIGWIEERGMWILRRKKKELRECVCERETDFDFTVLLSLSLSTYTTPLHSQPRFRVLYLHAVSLLSFISVLFSSYTFSLSPLSYFCQHLFSSLLWSPFFTTLTFCCLSSIVASLFLIQLLSFTLPCTFRPLLLSIILDHLPSTYLSFSVLSSHPTLTLFASQDLLWCFTLLSSCPLPLAAPSSSPLSTTVLPSTLDPKFTILSASHLYSQCVILPLSRAL